MGVDELKGYLEEIKDSIRNKTYKPELVRRVEIPTESLNSYILTL